LELSIWIRESLKQLILFNLFFIYKKLVSFTLSLFASGDLMLKCEKRRTLMLNESGKLMMLKLIEGHMVKKNAIG